ncbi:hypothetical protein EW146_g7001 [Bondarzewia mesenterica]|uniref:Major facilitator superfamily (MFS) profile domain-containing protein n=1 Tax=Bondarzewia mesenterica TaxID=1095465 RepID=A0A4S4LNU6_9AGAM|nr:hypothetical protein EW146_g7001 [Bondarzewia mesenterica]
MVSTGSPLREDEPSSFKLSESQIAVHVPAVPKGFKLEAAQSDDEHIQRRATMKVDVMIIPLVGIIYLLSFLDRSNIGNARIAGLQRNLKMTDHQYSVSLTVFYVPYVLMEIPMNLLLKRVGANITIPSMVVLWGGLFPSLVLYLSSFYQRHALQLRVTMMFSVTSLAGAFSGLLAAAIEQMDGIRDLAGWAWIFVLEGVFTALFGIFCFFLLPPSPSQLRYLNQHEKLVYIRMLRDDWSGDADGDDEKFSWSEVWSVFVDAPHVLILCAQFFIGGVTLFGLATFTPTIINALGFSTTHSQLLTVPPYACSFVVSLISARLSDKYKQRGWTAILFSLLAIPGYAIFIGTANKHANYGALFLQIVGIYGVAPCTSTWNANNVQPHYRRATAVGLAFVFTNLGGQSILALSHTLEAYVTWFPEGMVSTWIFVGPPRFHSASAVNLSFAIGSVALFLILIFHLRRQNAVKCETVVRQLQEKGEGTEKGGWDSPEERRRLGDRHPRFIYTL